MLYLKYLSTDFRYYILENDQKLEVNEIIEEKKNEIRQSNLRLLSFRKNDNNQKRSFKWVNKALSNIN